MFSTDNVSMLKYTVQHVNTIQYNTIQYNTIKTFVLRTEVDCLMFYKTETRVK